MLVGITAIATAFAAWLPRMPQPLSYHDFADHRALFGVANFGDVVSNLPFLLIGIAGLVTVLSRRTGFRSALERSPYVVFFLGVGLTSLGSSYYHLQPDNARLVWDRLPMTLGFMGVLAAVLSERVSRKAGLGMLPLFVAAGIASVMYWHATETIGRGDLRPYLLVQFGSLAIMLITVLLFRPAHTHQKWLLAAIALYAAAKYFEAFDKPFFQAMRVVSGHTLKHVAAAGGAYCILQMLRRRAVMNRSNTDAATPDFQVMTRRFRTTLGTTPTIS